MQLRPGAAAVPPRAAAALLAAILISAGCAYGPPTWRHEVENAMAQPREHRFAVIILSTQYREPRGLAAWPDGGVPRVLHQEVKLWLCDAEQKSARVMARVERPPGIESEYSGWIVGWDSTGSWRSVYLDVRGRKGRTSDTHLFRWLLKVEVAPDTSRAEAVSFLPQSAEQPRGPGPLRGGRELQVSAGDTLLVRTDTAPEFRPAFRVDKATGNVVPLP